MRVLLSILLLVLPGFAWAETRAALVLAAERYEALRPLQNPVNDARAIEDRLIALGFEVYTETNRDLRRMRRAFEDFADDAAGADVALVFFAGHGMEVAGQNLLLPVDAPADNLDALRAGGVPLDEVAAVLQGVAPVGLLIVDACRTDPFGSTGRGAMSLARRPEVSPGMARLGRADNLLYAFSAAPGQAAADGTGDNSPFTEALSRHLETPGLEIRQVLTLVQQDVYDRTRGKQLPYVESGLPAMVFAGGTTELPERESLLLAMAGLQPAHRGLIERIAAENDMPLAPLYGAFLSADLARRPSNDQTAELTAAALAFTELRRDMATLASDDPAVTALRQEAERQLELGAFETARARLTEAAEIDSRSRDALRENYLVRTLSEAETHSLNARAAEADLRRDLAIADYRRAAALFAEAQALSGETPDQLRLVTDQLGRLLMTTGDLVGAGQAFRQSLAAAEARRAAAPEDISRQRAVWVAQNGLGDVARFSGDMTGAGALYEAALTVIAAVAAAAPDRLSYQSDLAISQERLGQIRLDLGALAEAREAFAAALRISEALVTQDQANTAWQRGLGLSHRRLADVSEALGETASAAAGYHRALALFEGLRAAQPDEPLWQRDISILRTRLGDLALAQGDLAGAQTQYAAALELSRLLARQDTGNTELKRDLAIAFEKYGNVLQRLGDLAGAQAAYSAALAGRESLAARDPGNAQWQRDLAISHNLAGDIALALGDAAAARGAYDRALARLLPLTAANAGLGRDISITYNKIGQAALAQGDPQAAGDAFRAGLAPMRALVAQNPAHTVWQSDLAVSHDFLGLALWNSGDLSGARRAFEESLRLTTALLAQDPDNRAWQRSLAISHDRLGGLAQAGGDLAAAAASFGAARDLRAALLAANPDNLLWRQDLAYSHGNLGSVALGQGDAAAARQAFAEALTIQRDLVQRDPANARWRHDIALTLSNLARSDATPRAHLTEALAIVTALRAENQLLPLAEGWADDLETALSGLNVPE
ncbi:caspase family protein [Marinovum algicola]|uniref:caspase family protein n=1 Tax=Marinovum algicola TaxID=42444 RepID=UPI0024BA9125|nr:caspase family protein [Marinovum algicola]